MAVKYFVKGFDGRVDMRTCKEFNLAVPGYDDKGRAIIVFESDILTSEFHVQEGDISIKVNGCDKTLDKALERVFDNIDDIKSFGMIARDNHHLDIQIIMSR